MQRSVSEEPGPLCRAKIFSTAWCLTLLFLGLVLACARPDRNPTASARPRPQRRDIVIFLIDALRADRAADATSMPTLARWAKAGTSFDFAFTNGDWTRLAVPSLLTGLWVGHHGSWLGHQPGVKEVSALPDSIDRLPTRLRAFGYRTALATAYGKDADYFYGDRFNLGYGFDELIQPVEGVDGFRQPWALRQLDEILLNRVRNWIAAYSSAQPFVLYVHLLGAHAPFDTFPADEARLLGADDRRTVQDLQLRAGSAYAGLVPTRREAKSRALLARTYALAATTVDRLIGPTLDQIAARPRPWVVTVVSDHGEGLEEERGVFIHASGLRPQQIRIPMIWVAPGLIVPGRTAVSAQLADVFPTLCSLVGAPVPENIDGRDLSGVLTRNASAPRVGSIVVERNLQHAELLMLEDPYAFHYRGWDTSTHCGYIDMSPLGSYSCAENAALGFGPTDQPQRYLYDLRADPDGQVDVTFTEPALYRRMMSAVESEALASRTGWTARFQIPRDGPFTFRLVTDGQPLLRAGWDEFVKRDSRDEMPVNCRRLTTDRPDETSALPESAIRWLNSAPGDVETSAWKCGVPPSGTSNRILADDRRMLLSLHYGLKLSGAKKRSLWKIRLQMGHLTKTTKWLSAGPDTTEIWDTITVRRQELRECPTVKLTAEGHTAVADLVQAQAFVADDSSAFAMSADRRTIVATGMRAGSYGVWFEPGTGGRTITVDVRYEGRGLAVSTETAQEAVKSPGGGWEIDLDRVRARVRLAPWESLQGGIAIDRVEGRPVEYRKRQGPDDGILKSLGYVR
jgi:arylsulfatase A-like enzyme